jgi:N-acyl-D-aspartate/D-glutamate deacylase
MRDPDIRRRILAEAAEPVSAGHAFWRQYELYYAMGDPPNYSPDEADRLDNVARRRGISMAELAYETMLENDGRGIIYFPARNFTSYNLDTVQAMLQRDDTVLGLGDGGAHVGAICDGSMQTFMLSYWTRDRQGPRLSIPWVVQAMTSHTAGVIGLHDRGLLKPGCKADLNVIDYDRLRLHAPVAKYDLPAGGRRLYQRADGYDATILSGTVTFRDGRPTGELPGRLVRGQKPRR